MFSEHVDLSSGKPLESIEVINFELPRKKRDAIECFSKCLCEFGSVGWDELGISRDALASDAKLDIA
jgi:hypothetical protein